jgi:hypothetical protein
MEHKVNGKIKKGKAGFGDEDAGEAKVLLVLVGRCWMVGVSWRCESN